jgi:hypothetical protein
MEKPKGKGIVVVLKEFFGYRAGEGIHQFSEEVKQLSEAEKLEMAQAAAKQLGYIQEQVQFPLE